MKSSFHIVFDFIPYNLSSKLTFRLLIRVDNGIVEVILKWLGNFSNIFVYSS